MTGREDLPFENVTPATGDLPVDKDLLGEATIVRNNNHVEYVALIGGTWKSARTCSVNTHFLYFPDDAANSRQGGWRQAARARHSPGIM